MTRSFNFKVTSHLQVGDIARPLKFVEILPIPNSSNRSIRLWLRHYLFPIFLMVKSVRRFFPHSLCLTVNS